MHPAVPVEATWTIKLAYDEIYGRSEVRKTTTPKLAPKPILYRGKVIFTLEIQHTFTFAVLGTVSKVQSKFGKKLITPPFLELDTSNQFSIVNLIDIYNGHPLVFTNH